MSAIEIRLTDTAAAITRQLATFPDRMGAAIFAAMDHENELTIGHIQAERLSRRGPETLGVVTNRLRSSIRKTNALWNGNRVDSSIGTNVEYAGVHEFGFDGDVNVRAHTRHVHLYRQGTLLLSKGLASIRARALGKTKIGKAVASGISQVRAHVRHMKIKARAPIQRGIRDRADNYSQAISRAIEGAWRATA